jgi:hypothetical protein
MNRLLLVMGALIVFAAMAAPERTEAACSTSVFARHPCPSAPSVLRGRPYTPYSCGVFDGPCNPESVYPLNEVPVLKVQGHVGPSAPLDRDHPVDKLYDLGPLLSKCLEMPRDDEVRPGMRVTLKLAFKRNGELLADPRFTFTTHEASEEEKKVYHEAALDMLKRCTPLPITAGLGGAIAGRPLVVPIIETRNEKKASDDAKPPVGAPTGDKPSGDTPAGDKPADTPNDPKP